MKVRLLKNCKPIYYNLEKWNISQSPLLLVTGLSGSGKTTFAKRFAKEHQAICISFDVLKFYPEASRKSQELLNIFLKKHPEIKKHISIRWAKTDKANSNDILFNYYCNLFFEFLIEYSLQNKKKMVIEGIQMFVRLHPAKSVGLPVIIIRSSCAYSFFNKLARDYLQKMSSIKDFQLLKHIISDIYIYYITQRRFLNTYIKYLSTIYKNASDGGKNTNEYHIYS